MGETPAGLPLLTTIDVARRLGITRQRALALIHAGRLPAHRVGRDWFVRERDLAKVAVRKPGRPRMQKA